MEMCLTDIHSFNFIQAIWHILLPKNDSVPSVLIELISRFFLFMNYTTSLYPDAAQKLHGLIQLIREYLQVSSPHPVGLYKTPAADFIT
jgi:hypothetical protein